MLHLLANSATPLMWRGILLLLVGNVFIGLVEGAFLCWILNRKFHARVIALCIGANYISAFCGTLVFGLGEQPGLSAHLFPATIYTYPTWIAAMLIIALLLSIIIELPFIRLARPNPRISWKQTITGAIIINIISYLLCIAPTFGGVGDIHITDDVEITRNLGFIPDDLAMQIYYIDADDGDVYRMQLNGSHIEHVADTNLPTRSKLVPLDPDWEEHTDASGEWWDVWTGNHRFAHRQRMSGLQAPAESSRIYFNGEGITEPMDVGWAADLRPADADRRWNVVVRGNAGIQATRLDAPRGRWDSPWMSKPDIEISFDTQFANWRGRAATILPGDLVIFELGGQICALDLNQRKLAMIRRGYSPLVIPDLVGPPDLRPD